MEGIASGHFSRLHDLVIKNVLMVAIDYRLVGSLLLFFLIYAEGECDPPNILVFEVADCEEVFPFVTTNCKWSGLDTSEIVMDGRSFRSGGAMPFSISSLASNGIYKAPGSLLSMVTVLLMASCKLKLSSNSND